MRLPRLALLPFALMLLPASSSAHETRPALLRIEQRADGLFDITWKRPMMENDALRLVPHVTGGLIDRPPDVQHVTATFQLESWHGVDAGLQTLDARELTIQGLDRTITNVIVSIRTEDRETRQTVLTPTQPKMFINTRLASGAAVRAYLLLGIDHILAGYDHLAFLLGLVLVVAGRITLVKTITAFTVAHSITLGLAALGLISIRPVLIEALVALSVMLVAVELVYFYRGRLRLMARYPWLIALAFGLLHGCAFAGALAEIGLPKNAALLSLLLFNIGVEIGQLVFVGALLAIAEVIARLPRALPSWARWLTPYAIGAVAAFWFIDRVQTVISMTN